MIVILCIIEFIYFFECDKTSYQTITRGLFCFILFLLCSRHFLNSSCQSVLKNSQWPCGPLCIGTGFCLDLFLTKSSRESLTSQNSEGYFISVRDDKSKRCSLYTIGSDKLAIKCGFFLYRHIFNLTSLLIFIILMYNLGRGIYF